MHVRLNVKFLVKILPRSTSSVYNVPCTFYPVSVVYLVNFSFLNTYLGDFQADCRVFLSSHLRHASSDIVWRITQTEIYRRKCLRKIQNSFKMSPNWGGLRPPHPPLFLHVCRDSGVGKCWRRTKELVRKQWFGIFLIVRWNSLLMEAVTDCRWRSFQN